MYRYYRKLQDTDFYLENRLTLSIHPLRYGAMSILLSAQPEFVQFGPAHLSAIALLVVVSATLSATVRYTKSLNVKRNICRTLAIVIIGVEWFKYVFIFTHDGFEEFLGYALPLHACGIAVYLAAYMLITKRQVAFEIVYFWGLAGTTQAILTPALESGFPSYRFFQFFIEHSGVLIAVFIVVFGLKMRPRIKGLWITYGLSWCLVFVIGGLNYLLGTNYMYLCAPPVGVSPFYFLEWPWYILFLGGLGLVLFFLLWLPFYLLSKSAAD